MSTTIDQRVVEMRFDNKRFETNIQTSLSSIEKLKQSLKFKGATEGLENVGDAAKNCNLSGIGSAVETVKAKFTALEVMAVTALVNITNSAINAGKRIVNALTLEPISTGFNEYELKMGSIQTIMASTGESLETVNRYLGELNEYSDRTIYSFSDMTSNIGKFTNAGVKLEDAVLAIKGVSNVAAVSGANANEASRAMYNFAQALSSGYVKLIDWKSIENANMATVEFKNYLLEAAVASGTLRKTSDGMYRTLKGNTLDATRNFNDTLQDQWMTTEVLVATLKEYADETTEIGKKAYSSAQDIKTFTQLFDTLKESAQSGWAQSWEIIVGDFDTAKELLKGINNVLGEFISASANARNEVLQDWADLGGRATLLEGLKNAFSGISEIIKPVKEAFGEVFPPLTAERLVQISENIRNLTANFKLSETGAANLKSIFKGVFSTINIGIQVITGLVKGVVSLIGAVSPAINGLLSFSGSIGEFVSKINESINVSGILTTVFIGLEKIITPVAKIIGSAITYISNAIKGLASIDIGILDIISKAFSAMGKVFASIKNAFSGVMNGLGFESIFDAVNGGLFAGILLGIKKLVDSFSEIASSGSGMLKGITDILDGVRGSLEALQSQLKAGALLKIASAIAILAASLVVLSLIDSNKMTASLGAITTLFVELFASMAVFEKIMGSAGFKNMGKMTVGMIGLSTAVLILSSALAKIGQLDIGQILKGLGGIAALVAILATTANVMGNNDKAMIKGAGQMILMSSALVILSGALKIIGSMKINELGMGLLGIAGGLTAMVVGLTALSNIKGFVKGAASLLVLSVALNALGTSLKIIGSMSWEELKTGLIGIAAGLGAMVVALGVLSLLGAGTIAGAASLLVLSVALNALGASLKIIGSMSWEELKTGLIGLGGALAIMVAALGLLSLAGPMVLASSAAIAVLSASLLLLAPALKMMGSMNLSQLGMALLTMFSSLALLAGASVLLAPLTPVMLALSGAVALFGVGALAAGAGVLALSAGLTALGVAFTVNGAAIITCITELLNLIPTLATNMGKGIVALVSAIGDGSDAILKAVTKILKALLQAVIDVAPKLGETVATILIEILNVIIEVTPKIVETVLTILSAILDGIVEFVPKLVDAGMKVLAGFLQGIADNIGSVVKAGVDIVVNFLEAIGNELPRIVDAGFNMIINFINGLTDSINTNTPILTEAIGDLMSAVINAAVTFITGSVDNFVSAGGELINGFITGIKNKITDAASAAAEIGSSALNSIKSFLGIASPSKAFIAIGKYIGEGLAKGIKDSAYQSVNAVEDSAAKIKKVAKMSFKDAEAWVDDAKFFKELSLEEELAVWEAMIQKYGEGTEERIKAEKNAFRVYEELHKENYQNSMDWIEQEKYYKRLSLEDELAAYERVQTRYKEGSDEWLKMEREKYRLRNEIVDASYQNSMNWIEEEKYYSRLSLIEELSAYKRVQARYDKNSEEYKKMAKEIYRVQKDINEATENYYSEVIRIQEETTERKKQLEEEYYYVTEDINERLKDDIQAVNDEYESAVESRAKTLYDSYSLFEKVDPAKEVDGSELITNLQSQVDAFEDWEKDINELGAKGLNEELLKELQEMGPSSAAQIKALNKLTESELNQYKLLWLEKHDAAKRQSIKELEELKIETQSRIADLRSDAEIELDEYRVMWNEEMQALTDDSTQQLKDLKDEWMKTIGALKDDTESEFTKLTEDIINIVGDSNDWSGVGASMIEGILLGINNKTPELTDGITDSMTSALIAAKQALGINSPSKEFMKLGMYSDEGFANGLKSYASIVGTAAKDVGRKAISALSTSINNISSSIIDGIDSSPTIRPVLDLSEVKSGAKLLDGLFGTNTNMSISMNSSDINSINELTSKLGNLTDASNGKIVDAISMLRSDVTILADAIREMKIVMDTGTLVGAISNEMDMSLGQIALFNGRGI